MYCLDANTGNAIWNTSFGEADKSPTFHNNKVFFISYLNNTLYSVDVNDGRILWQIQIEDFDWFYYASIVVAYDKLFVAADSLYVFSKIDSVTPNPANEDETITFKGHGEDIDGEIIDYMWSWDNYEEDASGIIGREQIFKRKLPEGRYNISFKVKDNSGLWSDDTPSYIPCFLPLLIISTVVVYKIYKYKKQEDKF